MSQLTYLLDEICCGLEIYFSGRTGGQYWKTAFILCDDYAELLSKLYLLENQPNWSDKKANGRFKNFDDILKEVKQVTRRNQIGILPRLLELQVQIRVRRQRRNDFFHSTHLLDLNVNTRNCVEAFCDLIEYGNLLFPNNWQDELRSCRQMETLETLLLLERQAFNDITIWYQVNDILKEWPRRNHHKRTINKRGTQYAEYPEDLHLRLCVIWGGLELCQKLKTLL